jgi:hypothetical protein
MLSSAQLPLLTDVVLKSEAPVEAFTTTTHSPFPHFAPCFSEPNLWIPTNPPRETTDSEHESCIQLRILSFINRV